MRFFGNLFMVLGVILVVLTLLFAYFVVSASGWRGGLEQLALLGAGAAGSLGLGVMARRRR